MRPPGLILLLLAPASALDLGPRALSSTTLSPPVVNLLLVALITSLTIAALTLLGRCPIPRGLLVVFATLASVYVLALLIQFSSDLDAALRSYADPAGPLGRVYPVPFDVPVARARGLALPAAILACATCIMLLVLPVVLAAPSASARKTPTSESPPRRSVLALLTGVLVIVVACLGAAAHLVRRAAGLDTRMPGAGIRAAELLPGRKGAVASRPRMIRMQEFQQAVCGEPELNEPGSAGSGAKGGGEGEGVGEEGEGPGAGSSGPAPEEPPGVVENPDGPDGGGGVAGVVRQGGNIFDFEIPPRLEGIANCTGIPPPHAGLDNCLIARANTSEGLASCMSGEDGAGQPVASIKSILALLADDIVRGQNVNTNGRRESGRAATVFAATVIVTGVITPPIWLGLFFLVGMPSVIAFWAVGALLLVPLCFTLFIVSRNIGTQPVHEIASVVAVQNFARVVTNDPPSVYIIAGPGLVTRELLRISGAALVAIMGPLLVAALSDPGNAVLTTTALLRMMSLSGRQKRPGARYPRAQARPVIDGSP